MELGPSTCVALLGRPGALPFTGYFRGVLDEPGAARVCWAGRVTGGADPERAWRASRSIHRALARMGAPQADRRRALSILWARLDGVPREELGADHGASLSLLLVAGDPDGIALSGVGLGSVFGVGDGVRAWVEGAHPLLGPAGLPAKRPGAVLADAAPPWLVGIPWGDPAPHESPAVVLGRCGVHR